MLLLFSVLLFPYVIGFLTKQECCDGGSECSGVTLASDCPSTCAWTCVTTTSTTTTEKSISFNVAEDDVTGGESLYVPDEYQDEPVAYDAEQIFVLVGGLTYDVITDMTDGVLNFLAVCTSQMTAALNNAAEDVECLSLSQADDGAIQVLIGSDAQANLDSLQSTLVTGTVDLLVYQSYSLYVDLVQFTQEFEQDYDSWVEESADVAMFPLACYNALYHTGGIELTTSEMQCDEPVKGTEGNVVITFTVPSDREAEVQSEVNIGMFVVAGFGNLNAVAESNICEKLAQATVVMMISNTAVFETEPTGGDETGVVQNSDCFHNYTAAFVADRRNIDELAGYDLTTIFALFADTMEHTASLVAQVESYGYVTVHDANSIGEVAKQRSGNGCECDIEQENTVEEIVIDDYELSGAGLVVGLVGVLVFFTMCIFIVNKRDALFTNPEEIDDRMKRDDDALAKISAKEKASKAGEKVLPKWEQHKFTPKQDPVSKKDAKMSIDVKEEEAVFTSTEQVGV